MSERKAILRPLVLALIVGLGFAVAWTMVFVWCYATVQMAFQPLQPFHRISVLKNGAVVESTRLGNPTGKVITTTYTLDGETVSESDHSVVYLDRELERTQLTPPRQVLVGPYSPLSWSIRIKPLPFGRSPISRWYLVHNGARRGRAYLVGYDGNSKLPAGYIGRSGFRLDEPPSDEYFVMEAGRMDYGSIISGARLNTYDRLDDLPPVSSSMVYLALDDRLVEVDLANRKVRTIIEEKDIYSLGALTRASRQAAGELQDQPDNLQQFLAIRMKERVVVIDPVSGQHRDYALPAELSDYTFSFYELLDDTALIQFAQQSKDGTVTNVVRWINAEGETLREEQFAGRQDWPSVRAMSCIVSLAMPVPAIIEPYMLAFAQQIYLESDGAEDFISVMGLALSMSWPGLVLINLVGIVSAWLCYRRQKRYARPWTRTWVAFVFLFGVPGLVGYLFHRRWPPRLPCPECDAPAPRDREACAACGKQFAPPAPKGIEVFA